MSLVSCLRVLSAIECQHHVDLAKVQTQQENRLWPFFSALESFFFAGLSEWNLKKIWKIQKNYSHTNSEWF
jgi:hypothetical protein